MGVLINPSKTAIENLINLIAVTNDKQYSVIESAVVVDQAPNVLSSDPGETYNTSLALNPNTDNGIVGESINVKYDRLDLTSNINLATAPENIYDYDNFYSEEAAVDQFLIEVNNRFLLVPGEIRISDSTPWSDLKQDGNTVQITVVPNPGSLLYRPDSALTFNVVWR